jgi:hypothetical protein
MVDEGKSQTHNDKQKVFFSYLEEGGEVLDNPIDRIEA